MMKTPLLERIERYRYWTGNPDRVPLHPDELFEVLFKPSVLAEIKKEFPGIKLVPMGH